MNIILLEKIRNLGTLGDQVKVKSGYARNYLIPKSKAVFASKENIAKFEQQKADFEKKAAQKLAAAQQRAQAIVELAEVTLQHLASEDGKLYGSINVREIAEAITTAGIKVDKNEISLPNGPIQLLGEHNVEVLLHSDVVTTINVKVQAQS